jgi:dynein heavy chain, axonemal
VDPNFMKTTQFKLNPKAITSYQLYGKLDPDTKGWTNGVLPEIMERCEKQEKESKARERFWISFDGPVDAVWIENMNTVLDDNRVLCLTNGQKIRVTTYMNLMFEVEDLFNASPATVSRCGMVFLQQKQLGWQPLVQQYIDYKLPTHLHPLREFI